MSELMCLYVVIVIMTAIDEGKVIIAHQRRTGHTPWILYNLDARKKGKITCQISLDSISLELTAPL